MDNIVGKNIRLRREELGLTQTDLAKRLGYKSRVSVCTVETGKEDLTTERVRQYAKALNCSPADLMGWSRAEENFVRRITAYHEKLTKSFDSASEKDKKAVCMILDIPYENPK